MIDVSQGFRAAVTADTRRTTIRVDTDVVDPDLTVTGITASSEAAVSRSAQLRTHSDLIPYATLERNRWVLAGDRRIFRDDGAGERAADKIGFVSGLISGLDGTLSAPVTVTMELAYDGVLRAAAVYFSADPADGVPMDFAVEILTGETTAASWSVTGNIETESVCPEPLQIWNPTGLRLTVTAWSLPGRRVRLRQMIPGLHLRWTEDDLAEVEIRTEGDPSCASLPYGTAKIAVDNSDKTFEPRNKEGFFRSIQARQAVEFAVGVYVDGEPEWVPAGTYYQHSGGWSSSDNGLSIDWDLVDVVGLLAEKEFIVPDVLPTTLEGWVAAIVAQLGPNFAGRYSIDPAYAALPVTVEKKKSVRDAKVSDLLRYLGLITGTWPRADVRSGALTFEPLWDQGVSVTLENMQEYPNMSENDDVSTVTVTRPEIIDDETGDITEEEKTIYPGTNLAASHSIGVAPPFVFDRTAADRMYRQIIRQYGGNAYEITWRGDPSSEIGDVVTLALDQRHGASARVVEQTLSWSGGVLAGCKASLIQPEGYDSYGGTELLTESGAWTVPAGVTVLRLILVGGGWAGQDGDRGTDTQAGLDGYDGKGGHVYETGMNVRPGQVLPVVIGQGGQSWGETPGETTFGGLSSASGRAYDPGYTDIQSASCYGRPAVRDPLPNTGDGGAGGQGGRQGKSHTRKVKDDHGFVEEVVVWDVTPGDGGEGSPGASGCVRIYYDRQGVTS